MKLTRTNTGPAPSGQDYQTDNPQRTMRAEDVDSDERPAHDQQDEPARLSWAEHRFPRHAIQAIDALLLARTDERVALTQALSDAYTALKAELYLLHAESVGEYGLQKETYERHVREHTVDDVHAGEVAQGNGRPGSRDARRAARRTRMPGALRSIVIATLVVADLYFFLALWRDVEEARGWWSAETLQALVYAIITPVVTATVAVLLGRSVASLVHRGKDMDQAHRTRLLLVAVPAGTVVLAILFAVTQRLRMLGNEQDAVPMSPVLVYSIFLLLPIALFLTEIYVNDEEYVVHQLRRGDWASAKQGLRDVIARTKGMHSVLVAAHQELGSHLSTTTILIREPLNAAADIMAQEWGIGDAHGSWSETLPALVEIHLPEASTGSADDALVAAPFGGWPELEQLAATLPTLFTGEALTVELGELTRTQEALVDFQPPSIELVLETVLAAHGVGDFDVDDRHRLILDGPASPTRRVPQATEEQAAPLHSVTEESA
jgi:hypothetical protein